MFRASGGKISCYLNKRGQDWESCSIPVLEKGQKSYSVPEGGLKSCCLNEVKSFHLHLRMPERMLSTWWRPEWKFTSVKLTAYRIKTEGGCLSGGGQSGI
jgi:hypothetical protein